MELLIIIILAIAAVGVSTVLGDVLSRHIKGEKMQVEPEDDIIQPAAVLLCEYFFGSGVCIQEDAVRGLLEEIARAWGIPPEERQEKIESLLIDEKRHCSEDISLI